MQDKTPKNKASETVATLPHKVKQEKEDPPQNKIWTLRTSGLIPHTLVFYEDWETKRKWTQKSEVYAVGKVGSNQLLAITPISEFMDNVICKKCVEEDASNDSMIDSHKFEHFVKKNSSEKISDQVTELLKNYQRD